MRILKEVSGSKKFMSIVSDEMRLLNGEHLESRLKFEERIQLD